MPSGRSVQAIGRAHFLDVDVFEKSLEMAVPYADISLCKSPNSFRAPSIDVAKQMALNLVVDGRSEERRI
jgi:hypothetical protein